MMPAASPHTHGNNSVGKIMLLVCLALLPASLMGVYTFGWPAFNLLIITTVAALAAEAWSLKLDFEIMWRALFVVLRRQNAVEIVHE